jgi:hypothetical protein
MAGRPGRIITFYSYKGGTGRTMALANVAWILASNGKRVLTVDWDLEAPGLHRYFRPFLLDQELTSSPGIIDLVWDFAAATVAPIESAGAAETGWHEDYADILRYAIALRSSFRPPGRLDFLPSGRQGPAYAARVNSFNWQNFYDRLGGGVFLESVKEQMRQEYDYVLIDSRTGVSDTSGVCTVQMPDDLVVCFTANHQSLEGAAAVASSVRKQWNEDRARTKGGKIFPVLMRAESGEKDKLELARQEAQTLFSAFLDFLSPGEQKEYWGSVEVSYFQWYAFEEVLAVFGDPPKRVNSLLGAVERLTQYLTDKEIMQVVPPKDEERTEVLTKALRSGGQSSMISMVLASHAEGDGAEFPLEPDLLDAVTSFKTARKIISILGFAASGKTFLANRLRDEFTGSWKVRPSPTNAIPSSPAGLELTYLVPTSARQHPGYLLVDTAGETFLHGLQMSAQDRAIDGIEARSYLAAVGLASAYILLIQAEDFIFPRKSETYQDKRLSRLLSGLDDLITAITAAKTQISTQSPEEFLRKGISQAALRATFSESRRCSQPICLLLSQADRLEKIDQTGFYDMDPCAFVLKFAPALFKAVHNAFDHYRFDFLSSFYGHDGSIRPDYRLAHHGAVSSFRWIDSLLKTRHPGVGSIQRVVEGNLPTRLAIELRRRVDPGFQDLWTR